MDYLEQMIEHGKQWRIAEKLVEQVQQLTDEQRNMAVKMLRNRLYMNCGMPATPLPYCRYCE